MTLRKICAAAALLGLSAAAVGQTVLTETFPDPLGGWTSRWLYQNSNLENYYVAAGSNCDPNFRGNNPCGVWIADTQGCNTGVGGNSTITFDAPFAARIQRLQFDTRCFNVTTITVRDAGGAQLAQFANVQNGAFPPCDGFRVDVVSTTGVGSIEFVSAGSVEGNTAIDNVSVTIDSGGDCRKFIHKGRGSGTLNGVAFGPADFTITSIVDVTARQSFGSGFYINHSISTIDIGGGVGTVIVQSGTRTFVNNSGSIVGYSRAGGGGLDLFNGPSDPALATWDMTTPIGPIVGNGNLLQWTSSNVDTNRGVLVFNNGASPASFQAMRCGPTESCDVIDFQSLEHRNSLLGDHGYQYDEDGYRFTKVNSGPPLRTFGTLDNRYPGSTAMFNDAINGVTTLRRIDGGVFNITSIDLANAIAGGPAPVTFTGFYPGGGSVVLNTDTGDPNGLPNTLQRIVFPNTFCGLERLEWTQASPFHQFDNIHVATPTRLDFQSLEQVNNGNNNVGYQYDEDGYRFSKVNSGPGFRAFGTLESRYPGSTALFNDAINGVTTLQRLDGGPFDICEIKLSNVNGGGPAPLAFTGTQIDGTTVNFNTDTGDPNGLPNTLQRRVYPADFRLLRKLEWVQTTPFHQFDDLVVACSNVCYACDCDLSTGVAVCDIFDFLCFQNLFNANAAYACDCDTSTGPGVCDIFDFLCFQNEFDNNCGRNH